MNREPGIEVTKIKRNKIFILISLMFLLILGNLVYFYPPTNNLIAAGFVLMFLSGFFLVTFIVNNSRRGCLLSLGLIGFFLLRYLKTFNYFSLVILILFLITVELLLAENKQPH